MGYSQQNFLLSHEFLFGLPLRFLVSWRVLLPPLGVPDFQL